MVPFELKTDETLRCEVTCCDKQLVVILGEITRDNQYPLTKVKCDICKSWKVIKAFIKCEGIAGPEAEKLKIRTVFYKYCADERKCGRSRTQCVKCNKTLFAQMVKQSDFVTIEYVKCTNKLCETVNRIAEINGPSEEILQQKARPKRTERAKKEGEESTSALRGNSNKNRELFLRNRFAVLASENEDSESLNQDNSLSDSSQTPVILGGRRAEKRKNSTSPGETGQREVKRNSHKRPDNDQNASASEANTSHAQGDTPKTSSQPAVTKNKPSRTSDKKLPAIVVSKGEYIDSDRAAAQLAKQTDSTFSVDDIGKRYFFRPRALESRAKLLELLEANPDAEYYTHGIKQERRPSRKFVAKGLRAAGYTEQELAQSITEDYAITPTRVIPLQKEIMLLIFPGEVDPRDIYEIYKIADQRVKIEKYKVKRTAVTQCKNCLAFGHVQAHCHMKKTEATVTITHENGEQKTVCSTCGGEGHTAKQAKCPAFKKEIDNNKRRRDEFAKVNTKKKATPVTRTAHVRKGVSFAEATGSDNQQNTTPAINLPESLELLGRLLTPEIVTKLVKLLTAFLA